MVGGAFIAVADKGYIMHFRRRSWKTALGYTRTIKQINRATGITAEKKPYRALSNAQRTTKRRMGYYSQPAKMTRFFNRFFKKR